MDIRLKAASTFEYFIVRTNVCVYKCEHWITKKRNKFINLLSAMFVLMTISLMFRFGELFSTATMKAKRQIMFFFFFAKGTPLR